MKSILDAPIFTGCTQYAMTLAAFQYPLESPHSLTLSIRQDPHSPIYITIQLAGRDKHHTKVSILRRYVTIINSNSLHHKAAMEFELIQGHTYAQICIHRVSFPPNRTRYWLQRTDVQGRDSHRYVCSAVKTSFRVSSQMQCKSRCVKLAYDSPPQTRCHSFWKTSLYHSSTNHSTE